MASVICGHCGHDRAEGRCECIPVAFWQRADVREAVARSDVTRIVRLLRTHTELTQEAIGNMTGLSQGMVSQMESGKRSLRDAAKKRRALEGLGILPPASTMRAGPSGAGAPLDTSDAEDISARTCTTPAVEGFHSNGPVGQPLPQRPLSRKASPDPQNDRSLLPVWPGQTGAPENDDMNRRELLRLFSVTGTLLALPSAGFVPGIDQTISSIPGRSGRLDATALDEYTQLNSNLWRVFGLTPSKSQVLSLVRTQLDVLTDKLKQPHDEAARQRLCSLTADLFQLAGEIFFDGNHYTDATHCYSLAASAAKEAGAFDLWACALTRHAFVAVYEQQFPQAVPLLELAAALARRGDSTLSTRYWVAAVQAETFAGLGDQDACQRALDTAEQVLDLPGQVHNGGWLRFDGSRLAEERGTCYVALGRSDLAETALTKALSGPLTVRRRAGVLTDLALLGVQRRDPEQVVAFTAEAVEAARQTGSGVINRKLRGLQQYLLPLLRDRRIRRLNDDITALTRPASG
ncbi:helix-turn-helix domain-containing protein [Thermobifida cellulosilytica]|uniref:helix-turn-helix domain-containing protein n=1 Tax=Thermobifida cellulosilytica TaxID=144786 RepID=UPI000A650795|nr:helix-turn-helix domain-containing protein [Thermobifida cellulosilytica]